MSFALIGDDSDDDDVSRSVTANEDAEKTAAAMAAATISGGDQRAAAGAMELAPATTVTSPGGTSRRSLAPQWARSGGRGQRGGGAVAPECGKVRDGRRRGTGRRRWNWAFWKQGGVWAAAVAGWAVERDRRR